MQRVCMIGLDIGTTTTRGLRISAVRRIHAVTGLTELVSPRVESRLPTRYTPFRGEDLDVEALLAFLEEWFAEPGAVGGGVLLTGLAARAPSAARLGEALRARTGEGVVLTASDPRLEAWVAFMARAAALSRAHPGRWVINLDIGGGTTNVAWGRDGRVLRTASLYVGARHLRFEPGGRRLAFVSPEARLSSEALGLALEVGTEPGEDALVTFITHQVEALAGSVRGAPGTFPWLVQSEAAGVEVDVTDITESLVTLSGGVGELVACGAGGTGSRFDDLGERMAAALARESWHGGSPHASPDAGLATVWGLTLHTTTFSGATTWIARPDLLPRRDLPVVTRLGAGESDASWRMALDLVKVTPAGGAIAVEGLGHGLEEVRGLGRRLAVFLEGWPEDRMLVLLLGANAGLALGQYATGFGRNRLPLVVLDQVNMPEARLISLGPPTGGVVGVTFSGL